MQVENITREHIEVFSVDVFDTFLLRRCTTHDGVFEHCFALAPIPADCRHMGEDFVRHRRAAQVAARRAAVEVCGSPHVTVEDIYRHFPLGLFGLTPDHIPHLVAAEFQAERELCFANPVLMEKMRALRAAGVRVGFVADSCWPASQLAELLRACAPAIRWDFLFASCDHGCGKADGLFALALGALNVAPAATVHLGDNDLADGMAARALGIRTLGQAPVDPTLEAVFHLEDDRGASRLDGGARAVRRMVAAGVSAGTSAAFAYGLHVLGPVLAAFNRAVEAKVRSLMGADSRIAVLFSDHLGPLPRDIWRQTQVVPAYGEADDAALNGYADVVAVSLTGGLAAPPAVVRVHPLTLLQDDSGTGFVSVPAAVIPAVCRHLAVLDHLRVASPAGAQVREGALAFVRGAADLRGFPDCFHTAVGPGWAACILSRAAMDPSEEEGTVLAQLRAAADADKICAAAEVRVIAPGEERAINASCLHGGAGDMQLCVPVARSGGAIALAVPASVLPIRGRVRALTMQWGDSTAEAMRSNRIDSLPLDLVRPVDMSFDHGRYDAGSGTGHLLIGLPVLEHKVGLLTLTVSPLH